MGAAGANLHPLTYIHQTITMNNTGEKVTVIGLGTMGAALAGALLAKGLQVTVWNRNAEKAAPLLEKGARVAKDITAAVEASPLIVICVSDYKVTAAILKGEGATALLRGRTLVQLSTGTPKEAREFDAWAQQHGAVCLNGDILAWPRQIGTSVATISICGNEGVLKQHEATLSALAGTFSYLGAEPGASAVLFSAAMAYLAGNWIGFCHGALICENEGFGPEAFGELIHSISPMLAEESKHMGRVIQNNSFTNPESTISTSGLDLHLLVQHSKEAGISKELPQFAADLFQRAIDAGYGAEEHAAIIKVLRKTA